MFERPFCQSDVVLGCVACRHLCVVNYTGGQAFVVKRALVFVAAIALDLVICIGVIVGISYFLVVFVDDRFHVVHTAVANFDVILVEKAVVFVVRSRRLLTGLLCVRSIKVYIWFCIV